jgi:hypothetical protein
MDSKNLLITRIYENQKCVLCEHTNANYRSMGPAHLRLATWEYKEGLSSASIRNYQAHQKTLCGLHTNNVYKLNSNIHEDVGPHGMGVALPPRYGTHWEVEAGLYNELGIWIPQFQCQDCLNSGEAQKLEIPLVPDHYLACDNCNAWMHATLNNYMAYGPYDDGDTVYLEDYLNQYDHVTAIREYQQDAHILCIPCHDAGTF